MDKGLSAELGISDETDGDQQKGSNKSSLKDTERFGADTDKGQQIL